MGDGTQLSEKEQLTILRMLKEKVPMTTISRQTGRSLGVISKIKARNAVKMPSARSGRPAKIKGKLLKKVINMAVKDRLKTRQIAAKIPVNVSHVTIQRHLKDNAGCIWSKRKRTPNLNAKKKEVRAQFAIDHARWDKEWEKVIWSDEKRFKLDGPDGLQYYWHHIDSEPEYFRTRQCGGGGIMVWGAFTASGTLFLEFVKETMDSKAYVKLMEKTIVRFINNQEDHYIYQQDNARVHTAQKVMEMYETHGIDVMEWPSCSPDLNPIENLWGYMVRKIYSDGKYYDNINQLKLAISEAWDGIPKELITKLVASMKERMFQVVFMRGDKIKY